jgi:hypothetical protein
MISGVVTEVGPLAGAPGARTGSAWRCPCRELILFPSISKRQAIGY